VPSRGFARQPLLPDRWEVQRFRRKRV